MQGTTTLGGEEEGGGVLGDGSEVGVGGKRKHKKALPGRYGAANSSDIYFVYNKVVLKSQSGNG